MFQFQLYPSANTSNFKIAVNSLNGVSAILDHQMGINENSLSGVAFYIKAINDYINLNNVGLSVTPIVSGFFNHIGFTNYNYEGGYPFIQSTDGIISGVNTVITSSLSIYDYPFIQSLTTASGIFNNSILDNCFVTEGTIKDFIFTGTIQNLYSGYITPSMQLYSDQQVIRFPENYPFKLDGSGVLNDITTSRQNFGFVDGLLSLYSSFLISNLSGVNVSGNLYINGVYLPNLNRYSFTTPYFNESLFNLKSHVHNGIDSAIVNFSNFKSQLPVNDHFSLIQSSGNVVIDGSFQGNDIGLSSSWEKVNFDESINTQQLLTCKDKLYIVGDHKLVEVDTGKMIEVQTENPRASVIATSNGDTPALIELISEPESPITGIRIHEFYSDTSTLYNIIGSNLYVAGGTLDNRYALDSDRGTRIGSKYYIMLVETFNADDPNDYVLSLYELDTILHTIRQVAYVKFYVRTGSSSGHFYTSALTIGKPVLYKNSLQYFYTHYSRDIHSPHPTIISSTNGVIIYNIIYRPSASIKLAPNYPTPGFIFRTFEDDMSFDKYGFNIYTKDMDATQFIGINKSTFSSAYFNGRPNIAFDNKYFKFSSLTRNRLSVVPITYPSLISTNSIVSYAGKLWTGYCLDTGRDSNDKDTYHPEFSLSLKKILGSINVTPKLFRPIIYRGWLYAILPMAYYVDPFTYYGVIGYTENIQPGAIVVRRRAAESDLVNINAYTL